MRRSSACLVLVFAFGCSDRGPVTIPETPDGTVQAVVDGIADQDPRVLWAALPRSYQREITGLIHQFAASVDEEIYDESFKLVQKIARVLEQKKSFILNHPMVSGMIGSGDLSSNWDSFVGVFETVANSEFSSVSSLQSFDMEKCLDGTGRKIFAHLLEVSKASDEDFLGALEQAKVELVKSQGNAATVKISAPDKPTEEIQLTKVEGRWLPRDLVAEWSATMTKAKDGLLKMAENKGAMTTQAKMGLGMAGAVIDQLDQAKTQKEFNDILNGLIGGMARPLK